MLKGGSEPATKEEFLREADVMLNFDHENVTVIQGVAVQQSPWLYVLEYCMYGDLRNVLLSCTKRRFYVKPTELLFMCQGVIAGMQHIAEKKYVHMDLAARNCLLGQGMVVKVADFGLTCPNQRDDGKDYIRVLQKNIKLAIKWLAPECLKERQFRCRRGVFERPVSGPVRCICGTYCVNMVLIRMSLVPVCSEESDVWATGVTMWEIFAYGGTPYPTMKNDETQKCVLKGEVLDQPRNCPDEVYAVMKKDMFAFKRQDRAKFVDLGDTFARVFETLNAKDDGPEPGKIREVGKLLNDPEVEKKMKEESRLRQIERKKKADEVGQCLYVALPLPVCISRNAKSVLSPAQTSLLRSYSNDVHAHRPPASAPI